MTDPCADLNAERAFLGGCLIRNSVVDSVRAKVSPADFFHPPHQSICQAIYDLNAANQTIDILTLANQLRKSKRLDAAGGEIYLCELTESTVSSANTPAHARIISDCAIRRKLGELGHTLISRANDPASELGEFAASARQVEEIISGSRAGSASSAPADFLPEYLETLEKLQNGGGAIGVPMPWAGLHYYTAGFVPGEVTILAARSGAGKTALALNAALYAAEQGYPVGILSMEMLKGSLITRFMAAKGEVDAQKFRTGHFSDRDWESIYRVAEHIKALPIRISDRRDLKPSGIRALCRKWKQEIDLKFLVVDYLQLVKPEVRLKSREQEVSDISRQIKMLALDLEIPILLLAQLNRDAEKESEPRLGHLRESGAIEQDADVILFIKGWKADPSAGSATPVKVIVGKGRNNASGSCDLIYLRPFLKFVDKAG